MNLKLVYETAYPNQQPFIKEYKSLYDFNFATILYGIVDEIATKPSEVSFLGMFMFYLDQMGLNLNDIDTAFSYYNSDFADAPHEADNYIYKDFSKNPLYEKINKAREILPELFSIPKKVQNLDENQISYSTLLFLTSHIDIYKKVLKFNKQNKDFSNTKYGRVYARFIDAYYSIFGDHKKAQELAETLARREGITQKDIIGIMKKMINTCANSKARVASTSYKQFKEEEKSKKIAESESWKNIVKLPDYVLGQDEALDTIMERLMGAHVGFKSEKEPVASFLLTGPTGVGKTETAKAIASLCYNNNIYTVDMASFKNDTDVSRLLGGSPNYVGYNDKNEFCDFIKEHPKCVLLFDEIDKAHSGCLDLLMRMIDEGEFINAKGEVISLKDAVIICTTNYSENKSTIVGFGNSAKTEEQIAGGFGFRKEMVGRFNAVIEYKRLSKESCKKIAEKYFLKKAINNFNNNNASKKIKLVYDETLLDKIIEDANTNFFGARDLKKAIQKNFITPVSNYIVKNNPSNVTLVVTENGIEVKLPTTKTTKKTTKVIPINNNEVVEEKPIEKTVADGRSN